VSSVAAQPAVETVWQWLAAVPDPEIPVISVVELGIVRDVTWQGEQLIVTITPTYSGCPATEAIREAIEQVLLANGLATAEVRTQLAPAWTTDWLGAAAREKLRAYGIAPPGPAARHGRVLDIRALAQEPAPACPRCGSARTRLVSRFGATPCKSAHVCEACLEPFERFKCH
jgi:ring-1,2-phenylacetyl-CoA epoxidase subunit PaaD